MVPSALVPLIAETTAMTGFGGWCLDDGGDVVKALGTAHWFRQTLNDDAHASVTCHCGFCALGQALRSTCGAGRAAVSRASRSERLRGGSERLCEVKAKVSAAEVGLWGARWKRCFAKWEAALRGERGLRVKWERGICEVGSEV